MNRIAILILCLVVGISLHGQNCMPDTTLMNQGIYPDSATNIPGAQVGVAYDATITAVVPADTMVVLIPGGQPVLILIDSIVLEELLNKPAWMSLTCEPPNCAFHGGTSGCGHLTGTPPPGEGGKTYEIGFVVTTYGRFTSIPLSQRDTNEIYYILYVDFGVGEEPIISEAGDVQLFPNPATDQLSVRISDPGVTQWAITDVLGRQVMTGSATTSSWIIPIPDLQRGMYFIELEKEGSREVLQWLKN